MAQVDTSVGQIRNAIAHYTMGMSDKEKEDVFNELIAYAEVEIEDIEEKRNPSAWRRPLCITPPNTLEAHQPMVTPSRSPSQSQVA